MYLMIRRESLVGGAYRWLRWEFVHDLFFANYHLGLAVFPVVYNMHFEHGSEI